MSQNEPDTPPPAISIRSYGTDGHAHAHDFAQLVLPLAGSLDIELEGQGARLDRTRAAYVPAGTRHAQEGRQPNRFLVVDLPGAQAADSLAARRFVTVTPAAAHLIDYMGAALEGGAPARNTALWTPLLLDALAEAPPRPVSRLAGLLAAMGTEHALGWTVADMAAQARLSTSRLHAVFREELGTTPHAWLAERRLEQVLRWLATTELPIAEIALRAGFSDQSALTRAVRKACGMTPAAYRRQAAGA